MASLYLLIPIALMFCVLAIAALLWAVNSGQYDDLDKEAARILAPDADELNAPVGTTGKKPDATPAIGSENTKVETADVHSADTRKQ